MKFTGWLLVPCDRCQRSTPRRAVFQLPCWAASEIHGGSFRVAVITEHQILPETVDSSGQTEHSRGITMQRSNVQVTNASLPVRVFLLEKICELWQNPSLDDGCPSASSLNRKFLSTNRFELCRIPPRRPHVPGRCCCLLKPEDCATLHAISRRIKKVHFAMTNRPLTCQKFW